MDDYDKYFDLIFRDALGWRDKAKGHLLSVKAINERMNKILDIDPYLSDIECNFEYRALMSTYMFLIGISLENGIKGLVVSREPNFKDFKEFQKKYSLNAKGGHGIVDMFQKNCTEIYSKYKDLLELGLGNMKHLLRSPII